MQNERVWDELLHGKDKSAWVNMGDVNAKREAAYSKAGKVWSVIRKAPNAGRDDLIVEKNKRIIAIVRTKVELPFRVIKRQFGYVKTRYRGLAKNRAHMFMLF